MAWKVSDTIDIDTLANLLRDPSFDDFWPSYENYVTQEERDAFRAAQSEGYSEEEAEDAANRAGAEASDRVRRAWVEAVVSVAQDLFQNYGLTLIPKDDSRGVPEFRRSLPHHFKVMPETSWNDAAEKILETINGVGLFEFRSLRDFLDSGPYTAREAVLSHLHYIRRYPDVYGGPSVISMFYDIIADDLRG